jgi:hypothetical protein
MGKRYNGIIEIKDTLDLSTYSEQKARIKSILEDPVLLNFHSTLLKLNYTVT